MKWDLKKDMTIGNPLKRIVCFAIPMVIANLFQMFYSSVDIMIVGKYVSSNALAAVGLSSVIDLLFELLIGFSNGLSVWLAKK